MTVTTTIRMLAAVVLAARALASSGLAAGEPKNEYPFTAMIGSERAGTVVLGLKHVASHSSRPAAGESKNTLPFTRR